MYRNREKSQLNVHLYIGYFPWKKRRQNFLLISSKEPRLKPSLAPAFASREGNWKNAHTVTFIQILGVYQIVVRVTLHCFEPQQAGWLWHTQTTASHRSLLGCCHQGHVGTPWGSCPTTAGWELEVTEVCFSTHMPSRTLLHHCTTKGGLVLSLHSSWTIKDNRMMWLT